MTLDPWIIQQHEEERRRREEEEEARRQRIELPMTRPAPKGEGEPESDATPEVRVQIVDISPEAEETFGI